MRNIFDIIGRLTKEEKRYFKIYLKRIQSNQNGSRVLELYDLVNRKVYENDDDLSEYFYPKKSKNAYYRLKNRLLDDLEKSLLIQHSEQQERTQILQQISLAQIYAGKSLFKEAFGILKKIERKAYKSQYYDLLTAIYYEITTVAFEYEPINLEKYLQLQRQNMERYQQSLQTKQLIQHLSYRLIKANFEVRDEALNATLDEIKNQLSLQETFIESPKLQFEISNTIRRILLQKRDFEGLEAYLISNLRDFEAKKLYNKDSHLNKIISLVWIINTLSKNLKFKEVPPYIALLHDTLLAYNKLFYDRYIWTYYQCLITQYFYSNQLPEAIALLESLSDEQRQKGVLYYDIFVRGNLSVIYFCQNDLSKSMTHIAPLFYKDTYNKLSVELQLRLSILELILHFENGDMNFIDYRINEIRSTFKKLLRQAAYLREANFLKILKRSVNKVRPFHQKNVIQLAQTFIEQSPPFGPGSNEFISYQLWLKSKLEKRDYYGVILEVVG